jgi:EAL domain-containing protein (putative c-di-GMP-specific phosphodiesterase class I)
MTKPAIIVVDDDPLILESLAVLLAGSGQPVYLCHDIESAEVVLERVAVSHVLADVQFSGRFGFEGLTFVSAVRRRQPETRVVLMSGYAGEALRDESLARGADGFLQKPFDCEQLERILGLSSSSAPVDEAAIIRFPSIAEIIGGPSLTAHFQPIVDLTAPAGADLAAEGTAPFAFEALARYGASPLAGSDWLFTYARYKGRSFELNAACVRRALAAAADLPSTSFIFINLDPAVLSDARDISKSLLTAAAAYRIEPGRIVVELTEEMPIGREEGAMDVVQTLRAAGVRFALDDFGSGYAHLAHAAAIQPSFMKVSQHLGTAFERDDLRRRILHGISVLASDLGCRLIVEGVESGATADALRASGVAYAQGYFFDRVKPAAAFAA